MTTYLQDNFTDSDSTALTSHTPDVDLAGNGWQTPASNSFTINSNRAEAADASNNILKQNTIDIAQSDVTITAQLTTRGQDSIDLWTGLIFRWSDSSNYWRLELITNANPAQEGIHIYKIVSGVETPVTDFEGIPWITAQTTTYSVRLHMSGSSIRVALGSDDTYTTPALAFEDSFNSTATIFGLTGHSRGAGHAAVDSLLIESPLTITYPEAADMLAWLKAGASYLIASDNGTPVDGELIRTALDLSNRASTVVTDINTNVSTHTHPQLTEGAWANGRDVITMSNVANTLPLVNAHAPFDRTDGVTLYIYAEWTDATPDSNHNDMCGLRMVGGTAADGDLRFFHYDGTPDNNVHVLVRKGDAQSGSSTDTDLGFGGATGIPHLVAVSVNWGTGNVIVRLDQSTIATPSGVGLWNDVGATELIWGVGGEADGNYNCKGEVAEFRLYDGAHTVAEMQAVEGQILKPFPFSDDYTGSNFAVWDVSKWTISSG